MKKYITFTNILYFVLLSVIFNSCLLVKASPYLLIPIIPLFILLNILPGINIK